MKSLLRSAFELLRIWFYIVVLVCAAAVSLAVLDPSSPEQIHHYSKGAV
ncbi:hypothetical protein [Paraburkholderia caribensis]|nr:hypothetical protein [Paraburkholderia caribensis]